ncbi:MAG: hypothetical protein DRI44_01040 [Chlamydiae bacterium]|nr:MAG: hypothetical protein DRI44_01040 [Chlamydiota bacterium]
MNVFDECNLRKLTAVNRFVSQPMEGNDCVDGGKPSEMTINRYKKLAQGTWGVVIVEAISVVSTSLARINGLILNEKNLDSFKKLVEEFKKINNDSILLFQISHSGMKSGDFSEKVTLCPGQPDEYKYLSTDEVEEIRQFFVNCALLAEKVGADGIDFKMCHGYFGAEMLRPMNARNDKWGGSFENRTRFLSESISEIKAKCKNKNFILGSRISMYEAIRGGCGTNGPNELIEDLTQQAKLIELMNVLGMDYVNISAGIPGVTSEVTRPTNGSKNLFLNHFRYAKFAKDLLTNLKSKMKVIGSAYSILKEDALDFANENIEKNYTDFVGFGRMSFADPLYPKKISDNEKINYCIACSGCSKLMIKQLNTGCIIYDDYYKNLIGNK